MTFPEKIPQKLRDIVQRVPDLQTIDLTLCRLVRLDSRSNDVYHVTAGDREWIIRLPGKLAPPARQAEFENLQALSTFSGAEQPLSACPTGVLVFRKTQNSRPLTRDDLKRPSLFNAFLDLLARLHSSTVRFDNVLDPLDCLRRDQHRLTAQGHRLPADLCALIESGSAAQALYRPLGLVPCHGDPHCGNSLLHSDGTITLFDWEYSARAPALWDLALLSLMEDFTPAQDRAMLDRLALARTQAFYATRFIAALVLVLWEIDAGDKAATEKYSENARVDHSLLFR